VNSFLYFAYGSNMLIERLRAKTRCPSAKAIGAGLAANYRVCFTKRSRDGSGKGALVPGNGHDAFGVLFAIDSSECVSLDAAEGHGYAPLTSLPVTELASGAVRNARSYTGLDEYLDDTLLPYDWYRALVLAGAMQNGLPAAQIEALRSLPARADPDVSRATRIEALCALREAGYENLLKG
jgi:gamma-glutamylcyclotransferase